MMVLWHEIVNRKDQEKLANVARLEGNVIATLVLVADNVLIVSLVTMDLVMELVKFANVTVMEQKVTFVT